MANISFEERQELDKKSAEKRSHFQTSIKISADDFKSVIGAKKREKKVSKKGGE